MECRAVHKQTRVDSSDERGRERPSCLKRSCIGREGLRSSPGKGCRQQPNAQGEVPKESGSSCVPFSFTENKDVELSAQNEEQAMSLKDLEVCHCHFLVFVMPNFGCACGLFTTQEMNKRRRVSFLRKRIRMGSLSKAW